MKGLWLPIVFCLVVGALIIHFCTDKSYKPTSTTRFIDGRVQVTDGNMTFFLE
jgi:hypothetical protein